MAGTAPTDFHFTKTLDAGRSIAAFGYAAGRVAGGSPSFDGLAFAILHDLSHIPSLVVLFRFAFGDATDVLHSATDRATSSRR